MTRQECVTILDGFYEIENPPELMAIVQARACVMHEDSDCPDKVFHSEDEDRTVNLEYIQPWGSLVVEFFSDGDYFIYTICNTQEEKVKTVKVYLS